MIARDNIILGLLIDVLLFVELLEKIYSNY